MPEFLTRLEIAAEYPITADYLARLAQSGKKRRNGLPPSPPIIRLSARRIVYDRAKFEAWLADPWSAPANDAGARKRGRPRKTE